MRVMKCTNITTLRICHLPSNKSVSTFIGLLAAGLEKSQDLSFNSHKSSSRIDDQVVKPNWLEVLPHAVVIIG